MLGYFLPVMQKIILNILAKKQQHNCVLQRVTVLSLCKYMTVSKVVCKDNLKLLFTLLSSNIIDSITKTNIIISLGDLMHRYPNITEPFTKRLYDK